MFNKLIVIKQIIKARQFVVVTDQSGHSSVHRFDESLFWERAKQVIASLEAQQKRIIK